MKNSSLTISNEKTEKRTCGLMKRLFTRMENLFRKTEPQSSEKDPAKCLSQNMKELRAAIDMQKKEHPGTDCSELIVKAFVKIRSKYTAEVIDQNNVWPRLVKTAVYSSDKPIEALVEYVNSENYRRLTRRMSDLSAAICKEGDACVMSRMDAFSEAVNLHILIGICPTDVPALLALGRLAQKRKDYENAEKWFLKVLETDDPYHGVTAILACYETEIKELLKRSDFAAKRRIKELNKRQHAVYEAWCSNTEERIRSGEASESDKRKYVALMTGYARFERLRDNYDKAFELLDRIPEEYPEMSRVYAEQAMIYQFKPYSNPYYNLEKAVDLFKKADIALTIETTNGTVNPKSRKSILMPLANAYFRLSQYHEAAIICDNVLGIDAGEQRAVDLKKRIAYAV